MKLKIFFIIFIALFNTINSKVVKIPYENDKVEISHKDIRLESVKSRVEARNQRIETQNRRRNALNEQESQNVAQNIQQFDDSEFISCSFEGTVSYYTCNLFLNNSAGRNDFEEISGTHIDDLTNNDVQSIVAIYQNSRNIPSIICSQFPNILDIIIEMSEVEIVDANTFVDCGNLEFIMIGINRIASIPDGLFRNNGNLQVILMNDNRITSIGANAFAGTAATYIDISNNELTSYNSQWLSSVNETMEILLINRNSFSILPYFAFDDLGNLRELDISGNPLSSVNDYTFLGLTNLQRLYMNDLNIVTINPNWFVDLTRLTHLYLAFNNIRELRTNDLDRLNNLITLNLNYNRLTFINADGFGSSINSLVDLYAQSNQIVAIEQEFLDASTNLMWLLLIGNGCINRNYYNVNDERDDIIVELNQCFSNFIGSARCEMFDMSPYPYECVLYIMNPVGRDFEEIQINHGPNRTNADVLIVEALFQNTRNFPNVVCRQFPNVEEIFILETQIEFINENSFVGCDNIWKITLSYNSISAIPDGTFSSNPTLQIFEVHLNRVNFIGANAFTGSGIRTLSMDRNEIREFNPATFESIAATLEDLFITSNQITEIPDAAFTRLTNLRWIDLSGNRVTRIPANAFRSLVNLEHLELIDCGILSIESEWFADLRSLFDLRLNNNNFNSIPPNAFNTLTSLTTIAIGNNNIRNLHANSFGSSLNTLIFLLAANNNIRAFDSEIFENSPNLSWLHLAENACASTNFYNVQLDRAAVGDELSECFRMFTGFISCTYFDFFAYTCRIDVQNVQGRNDFEEITGDHVEGKGNDDVRVIDAYSQDTANVPSIICRQFRELREMHVTRSHLQTVSEEMFEDCRNIETLVLTHNELTAIPDFLFINNPNLDTIEIFSNQIASIGANAFINLQLLFLDLESNQLTEFNPQWVASSRDSLVYIYMAFNQIEDLNENAFEGLSNLMILDIGGNPFRNIPSNSFRDLSNLRQLWFDMDGITDVDPQWFAGLNELRFLSFYENQIEQLRPGVFDNLPNLIELDIGHNRLTMLHGDSFGSTLPNILYAFLDFNQINSIDNDFFENTSSMTYLYLYNNICTNDNFFNLIANRDEARERLGNCFDNFNAPGTVSCIYTEYLGNYACMLIAVNPSGLDNHERVTGDHQGNFGDSDVTVMESANQNTRIVPSVICQQFINLQDFFIHSSQIMRITQDSFRNCANLRRINLNNNLLTTIESGVFENNVNLVEFSAVLNQIHTIAPSAFEVASLQSVFLGSNRLTRVDASFLSGNLRNLYLFENRISNVAENAFENLSGLEILDLGLNPGANLPSNVFNVLTNLQILHLDQLALTSINHLWFENLQNLREIYLQGNQLNFFQSSVFSALNSLEVIYIGLNPIESINSDIFGANLASIQRILAMGAQINAIDPVLLENSDNLDSFYLYENVCANNVFIDIINSRDEVMQQLETCFNNFRGLIECNFLEYGGNYNCILFINNIAGQDGFTDISGDHQGDFTNDNVLLVESLNQNTRNIPSVLCQQFVNLEEIFIEHSGISRITIGRCANLQRLTLAFNDITTVESGSFENNGNLAFLDLRMNRITSIDDDAFAGSRLTHLDLSSNDLTTFNPSWITSIVGSLQELILYENNILQVPSNSFDNLQNLITLDLGLNPNINLPSNIFASLQSLRVLYIDSSNVRNINAEWLNGLTQLAEFHSHSNLIRSLPEGTFSALTNLAYLSLRNNRLESINSNAFSAEMRNFTRFYAQSNRINAIDEVFFENNVETLNLLYLLDNVCVNMNFYDVSQYPSIPREELRRCFDNFQNMN